MIGNIINSGFGPKLRLLRCIVACVLLGAGTGYGQCPSCPAGSTTVGANQTNYNPAASGTYCIGTGVTITNLTISTGVTIINRGTITGTITYNGGNITNCNTVNTTSGVTVTAAGAAVNNYGSWTSGALGVNAGTFTNHPGSTSSYTALTLGSGGTFINNGSLTFSGGLIVNSGASVTLGGNTTINGNLDVNGTLTLTGSLTVNGNVKVQNSGSKIVASGSGCNRLTVPLANQIEILSGGVIGGAGSTALLVSEAPVTGSLTAPATTTTPTEPAAPGAVTLSRSGNNLTGTFSAASGATGYLVLARTGNAVTDVPVDYQTYAAGNTIGNSRVVYVGNATAFTDNNVVTGCDVYHYAVFSYGGAGCLNYKTPGSLASFDPRPAITGQPASTTSCPSGAVSFSVTTSGTSPTYQWQHSTDNGANWIDLSNGSSYSGVTSAALSISNVSGMNGRRYRAVVTSSGCSLNSDGTAAISFTGGTTPGRWTGNQSTDWFDCRNWETGVVPTSAINALIPNGLARYPVIGAAGAVCKDITIETGASAPSLTINHASSTLSVYGNFTNNGTFSHSAGLVSFTGAATQSIGGTGSVAFYNATVHNTAAVPNARVTLQRNVTVNHTLTLTAGALEINGNALTLNGTVLYGSGSGTITGSGTSDLIVGGTGDLGTLNFTTGGQLLDELNINRTTSGMVTLGTGLEVDNTLTLANGTLVLNAKTLYLSRQHPSAIARTNGLIRSEHTGNLSKVQWRTGAVTGNYLVPFGTASNFYIPFTFSLTAGDADVLTLSTYPTGGNNIPLPAGVTHLYYNWADNSAYTVNRFWQIDKSGTSGTATLTFTYADGEWDGTSEPSTYRAQRWDGTNWAATLASQTANIANNTVTVPNVSQFSPWTLATAITPLPLTWLYLSASSSGNAVLLKWATTREVNTSHFVVERADDGKTFLPLAVIATAEATGSATSAAQAYSYTDATPHVGTGYYRIRHLDRDGSSSYSELASALAASHGKCTLQNPVKGSLRGRYQATVGTQVRVALYSLQGILRYQATVTLREGGLFALPLPLPAGLYLCTVSGDNTGTWRIVVE